MNSSQTTVTTPLPSRNGGLDSRDFRVDMGLRYITTPVQTPLRDAVAEFSLSAAAAAAAADRRGPSANHVAELQSLLLAPDLASAGSTAGRSGDKTANTSNVDPVNVKSNASQQQSVGLAALARSGRLSATQSIFDIEVSNGKRLDCMFLSLICLPDYWAGREGAHRGGRRMGVAPRQTAPVVECV